MLEALGLNAREKLAAAAERHARKVDVPTLFGTDTGTETNGKISCVREEVHRADRGADDADIDKIYS